MKMVFQVVLDVDTEKWAKYNNGPWPEDDKRSLNTAVRQDLKSYIQNHVDNFPMFDELDVKAEVR